MIKLTPTDATAYYKRGNTYRKKEKYDRAIRDFDKAIEHNPTYLRAYNNRGGAYDEKGDYDRAIQDYDKAIELNPTYAETYGCRGYAYANKRDYDRVIQDYDRVIKLNSNNALAAYNNRGIIWLIKQKWNAAKMDLITAKDRGADIAANFQEEYQDITTFEKQHNVELPDDIVALLTQNPNN